MALIPVSAEEAAAYGDVPELSDEEFARQDVVGGTKPDNNPSLFTLNTLSDMSGSVDEAKEAEMVSKGLTKTYDRWIGPKPIMPLGTIRGAQEFKDIYERNDISRKGLFEELGETLQGTEVPVIGGFISMFDDLKARGIRKKLNAGERPTDEDLVWYNTYEEKRSRNSGETFAGKAADLIKGSLTFAAEIGIGNAVVATTLGKMASGVGSSAAKLAKLGVGEVAAVGTAAEAAGKTFQALSRVEKGQTIWNGFNRQVGKMIYSTAKSVGLTEKGAIAAGKVAEAAANIESHALVTQALFPETQARMFGQRRMEDVLTEGDETAAEALAMSFVDANIEFASEMTGQYIGSVAGKVLDKFPKVKARLVGQSIFNFIAGKYKTKTVQDAWAYANRVGVNNLLEEMGEERVADFMRGILGVNVGDKPSLVKAVKNLWPGMDQIMLEGVSFSVMPMLAHAADRMAGGASVKERITAYKTAEMFGPKKGVHAKTQEDQVRSAEEFMDVLEQDSSPIYKGIAWLENLFGRTKRGSADSMLTMMGLDGLTSAYREKIAAANEKDAGLTPEMRERGFFVDDQGNTQPTARKAVAQEIAGHFNIWQRVHTDGMRSAEDVAAFEKDLADGAVIMYEADGNPFTDMSKRNGYLYAANAQKDASRAAALAGRFDLPLSINVKGAVQTHKFTHQGKDLLAESWDNMSPASQTMFVRIVGETQAEARLLHDQIRAVKAIDGQVKVSAARKHFVVGTEEELSEMARGYASEMKRAVVVDQAKGIRIVEVLGTNQGEEIVVTRGGGLAAFQEEVVEHQLRKLGVTQEDGAYRVLADVETNKAVDEWVRGVRAKENLATGQESALADYMGHPAQRAEAVGKVVSLSLMGSPVSKNRLAPGDLMFVDAPADLQVALQRTVAGRINPGVWGAFSQNLQPTGEGSLQSPAMTTEGQPTQRRGPSPEDGATGLQAGSAGKIDALVASAVDQKWSKDTIDRVVADLAQTDGPDVASEFGETARKAQAAAAQIAFLNRATRHLGSSSFSLNMIELMPGNTLSIMMTANLSAKVRGAPEGQIRFLNGQHYLAAVGLKVVDGGRNWAGTPVWNQAAYHKFMVDFFRSQGRLLQADVSKDPESIWAWWDKEIRSLSGKTARSFEHANREQARKLLVEIQIEMDTSRALQLKSGYKSSPEADIVLANASRIIEIMAPLLKTMTTSEAAVSVLATAKDQDMAAKVEKRILRAKMALLRPGIKRARAAEKERVLREAMGSDNVQDRIETGELGEYYEELMNAAPDWLMSYPASTEEDGPSRRDDVEAWATRSMNPATLASHAVWGMRRDGTHPFARASLKQLIRENAKALLRRGIDQYDIDRALSVDLDEQLKPLDQVRPGDSQSSFDMVRRELEPILADEMYDIIRTVIAEVREGQEAFDAPDLKLRTGKATTIPLEGQPEAEGGLEDVTPGEAVAQYDASQESLFPTEEDVLNFADTTDAATTLHAQAVAATKKFVARDTHYSEDPMDAVMTDLERLRRELDEAVARYSDVVQAGQETKRWLAQAKEDGDADHAAVLAEQLEELRDEYRALTRTIEQLKTREILFSMEVEEDWKEKLDKRIAEVQARIAALRNLESRKELTPEERLVVDEDLPRLRNDLVTLQDWKANPQGVGAWSNQLLKRGYDILMAVPMVMTQEYEEALRARESAVTSVLELNGKLQAKRDAINAAPEGHLDLELWRTEENVLEKELRRLVYEERKAIDKMLGLTKYVSDQGRARTATPLHPIVRITEIGDKFVKTIGDAMRQYVPAERRDREAAVNAKDAAKRYARATQAYKAGKREEGDALVDSMYDKAKRALHQVDCLIIIDGDPAMNMSLRQFEERVAEAAYSGWFNVPNWQFGGVNANVSFSRNMTTDGESQDDGFMRVLRLHPGAGFAPGAVASMVRAFIAGSKVRGSSEINVGLMSLAPDLGKATPASYRAVRDGIVQGIVTPGELLEWKNRTRSLDKSYSDLDQQPVQHATFVKTAGDVIIDAKRAREVFDSGVWNQSRVLSDGSMVPGLQKELFPTFNDYARYLAFYNFGARFNADVNTQQSGETAGAWATRISLWALDQLANERSVESMPEEAREIYMALTATTERRAQRSPTIDTHLLQQMRNAGLDETHEVTYGKPASKETDGQTEQRAPDRFYEFTPAKKTKLVWGQDKNLEGQIGFSLQLAPGELVYGIVRNDLDQPEAFARVVSPDMHGLFGRPSHGELFGHMNTAGATTWVYDEEDGIRWWGNNPTDGEKSAAEAILRRLLGNIPEIKHNTWGEGRWKGTAGFSLDLQSYRDPFEKAAKLWSNDRLSEGMDRGLVGQVTSWTAELYSRTLWHEADHASIRLMLDEVLATLQQEDGLARLNKKLREIPNTVDRDAALVFSSLPFYPRILDVMIPDSTEDFVGAMVVQRSLFMKFPDWWLAGLPSNVTADKVDDAVALAVDLREALKEQRNTSFRNAGHSLRVDDVLESVTAPVMLSGASGLHRMYLEAVRNYNQLVEEAPQRLHGLMRRIGAVSEDDYKPTAEHKAKVARLLEAVGVALDEGEITPESRIIRRVEFVPGLEGEKGTYRFDFAENELAQPILDAWDGEQQKAPEGQRKPNSATILAELRSFYDQTREQVNGWLRNVGEKEWLRYLEDYVNHHYVAVNQNMVRAFLTRHAESSRHTGERKFPTYKEAAAWGLQPLTMNAAELYSKYAASVHRVAFNRYVYNYASAITDLDGTPVLVMIPAAKAEGVDSYDSEHSVVQLPALKTLAGNLSGVLERILLADDPRSETASLLWDESKPIEAELERLYQAIRQRRPAMYSEVISPFKSIARIVVLKGDSEWTMKHLLEQPWNGKLARTVETINAWSKYMGLALSMFHAFAMVENLGAAEGVTTKNPLLPWNWKVAWDEIKAKHADMRANPANYTRYTAYGLKVSHGSPDVKQNLIERQTEQRLLWAKEHAPWLVKPIEMFKSYQKWSNAFLWEFLQPTTKMMIFESAVANETKYLQENGIPFNPQYLMEEIAGYANPAVGGMEFEKFLYMSPKVRQALHWQWFAWDWTMSSADIAGITRFPGLRNLFKGGEKTPAMMHQSMTRYWPGMLSMTLLAVPSFLQFVVWGLSRPFVDPDDDMAPIPMLNEAGRKTHVDITPLAKLFGYKGAPTGKRRVYLRWGKQAWEVIDGWMQKPNTTFLSKQSALVRTAYEQITGSTGAGWDLEFKDTGMLGWITTPEAGFWGSRSGYIVKKFVPMSILSILDGKVSTFFAPSTTGMSAWKATTDMAKVLRAYAEDDVWNEVYGNDRRVKALEQLAPEILRAAEVNGYDSGQVLARAKADVLSYLFGKYFKALEDKDQVSLRRISMAIERVHGTGKTLEKSMKLRARSIGRELTDEERASILSSRPAG